MFNSLFDLYLVPRYATGSRDTTIKLWSPFSKTTCDQNSEAIVRPLRTLKGHSDAITCLITTDQPSSDQSSDLPSSSSSAAAAAAAAGARSAGTGARAAAVAPEPSGPVQSVKSLAAGFGSDDGSDDDDDGCTEGGSFPAAAGVAAAAFLISGSRDKSIKLWSLPPVRMPAAASVKGRSSSSSSSSSSVGGGQGGKGKSRGPCLGTLLGHGKFGY